MSKNIKLIIPLIDKDLSLEDISPKTGFVDAYTLDINKPFLTNHVFLLYKRIGTDEYLKTKEKLLKLKCLYNNRNIKINNELYILFSFTINHPIKMIKNNCKLLLNKDNKETIAKFWQFKDVDITDFLLGYSYIGEKFQDTIVPEEDFSPKDFITYDEKRGTLIMSASL